MNKKTTSPGASEQGPRESDSPRAVHVCSLPLAPASVRDSSSRASDGVGEDENASDVRAQSHSVDIPSNLDPDRNEVEKDSHKLRGIVLDRSMVMN